MRITIILSIIVLFVGCNLNVAKHNEYAIRDKSKEFCEKLIINKDFEGAYSLLNDDFKNKISKSQLKDMTYKVHRGNLPDKFEITEYETYAGKEYISVFVSTLQYQPKLYYRVSLIGSPDNGYTVIGFHVAADEIPAKGNKRAFSEKIKFGKV